MSRRWIVAGTISVAVALLLAAPSAVRADSPPEPPARDSDFDKAKRLGKKVLIGKWIKAKGLMYSIGAGWEAVDAVGITGELGYAWGRQRTGLSNMASLHHIAIAPKLMSLADEFDVAVEAAAMIGHSWRALAYFSVEAGANVRFNSDVQVGPIVRARIGYKDYGLYMYAGVSTLGDHKEGLFGMGVELFRLPSLGIVDTIKHTLQP